MKEMEFGIRARNWRLVGGWRDEPTVGGKKRSWKNTEQIHFLTIMLKCLGFKNLNNEVKIFLEEYLCWC